MMLGAMVVNKRPSPSPAETAELAVRELKRRRYDGPYSGVNNSEARNGRTPMQIGMITLETSKLYQAFKIVRATVQKKDELTDVTVEAETAFRVFIDAAKGCPSVKRIAAELVPRYITHFPWLLDSALGVMLHLCEWSQSLISNNGDADCLATLTATASIKGLVELLLTAESHAATDTIQVGKYAAVCREVATYLLLLLGSRALPLNDSEFLVSEGNSAEQSPVSEGLQPPQAEVGQSSSNGNSLCAGENGHAKSTFDFKRRYRDCDVKPMGIVGLSKLIIQTVRRAFECDPEAMLRVALDAMVASDQQQRNSGLHFFKEITKPIGETSKMTTGMTASATEPATNGTHEVENKEVGPLEGAETKVEAPEGGKPASLATKVTRNRPQTERWLVTSIRSWRLAASQEASRAAVPVLEDLLRSLHSFAPEDLDLNQPYEHPMAPPQSSDRAISELMTHQGNDRSLPEQHFAQHEQRPQHDAMMSLHFPSEHADQSARSRQSLGVVVSRPNGTHEGENGRAPTPGSGTMPFRRPEEELWNADSATAANARADFDDYMEVEDSPLPIPDGPAMWAGDSHTRQLHNSQVNAAHMVSAHMTGPGLENSTDMARIVEGPPAIRTEPLQLPGPPPSQPSPNLPLHTSLPLPPPSAPAPLLVWSPKDPLGMAHSEPPSPWEGEVRTWSAEGPGIIPTQQPRPAPSPQSTPEGWGGAERGWGRGEMWGSDVGPGLGPLPPPPPRVQETWAETLIGEGEVDAMDTFPASRHLWVGPFPSDVTEDFLRFRLEQYGFPPENVSLPRGEMFAIIDFASVRDAVRARERLTAGETQNMAEPLQVRFSDGGGVTSRDPGQVIGSEDLWVSGISTQNAKEELLRDLVSSGLKSPRTVMSLVMATALLLEFEESVDAERAMAHVRQRRRDAGWGTPSPSPVLPPPPPHPTYGSSFAPPGEVNYGGDGLQGTTGGLAIYEGGPDSPNSVTRQLVVRRVDPLTREDDLLNAFSAYGEIVGWQSSPKSGCFFVEYRLSEAAALARSKLNGIRFNGGAVIVEFFHPQRAGPGEGGGNCYGGREPMSRGRSPSGSLPVSPLGSRGGTPRGGYTSHARNEAGGHMGPKQLPVRSNMVWVRLPEPGSKNFVNDFQLTAVLNAAAGGPGSVTKLQTTGPNGNPQSRIVEFQTVEAAERALLSVRNRFTDFQMDFITTAEPQTPPADAQPWDTPRSIPRDGILSSRPRSADWERMADRNDDIHRLPPSDRDGVANPPYSGGRLASPPVLPPPPPPPSWNAWAEPETEPRDWGYPESASGPPYSNGHTKGISPYDDAGTQGLHYNSFDNRGDTDMHMRMDEERGEGAMFRQGGLAGPGREAQIGGAGYGETPCFSMVSPSGSLRGDPSLDRQGGAVSAPGHLPVGASRPPLPPQGTMLAPLPLLKGSRGGHLDRSGTSHGWSSGGGSGPGVLPTPPISGGFGNTASPRAGVHTPSHSSPSHLAQMLSPRLSGQIGGNHLPPPPLLLNAEQHMSYGQHSKVTNSSAGNSAHSTPTHSHAYSPDMAMNLRSQVGGGGSKPQPTTPAYPTVSSGGHLMSPIPLPPSHMHQHSEVLPPPPPLPFSEPPPPPPWQQAMHVALPPPPPPPPPASPPLPPPPPPPPSPPNPPDMDQEPHSTGSAQRHLSGTAPFPPGGSNSSGYYGTSQEMGSRPMVGAELGRVGSQGVTNGTGVRGPVEGGGGPPAVATAQWRGPLCKSSLHYCNVAAVKVEAVDSGYQGRPSEPFGWPERLDVTQRAEFKSVRTSYAATPATQREVVRIIVSEGVGGPDGFGRFVQYLRERDRAGVVKIPPTQHGGKESCSRMIYLLPWAPEHCDMLGIPHEPKECLLGLIVPSGGTVGASA